jgi:RNA polymerase sigma-70 factor (ECF subfamily)
MGGVEIAEMGSALSGRRRGNAEIQGTMNPLCDSAGPTTPHRSFVATRWTLVLRARGGSAESRAALGELCEAYYAAVHSFIRRVEPDPENARDLTQAFFADLLAQQHMGAVEPGRGRFRSCLLGAVKHFLAESHRKAGAAKRGGRQTPVSLEAGASRETTSEWQIPDPAATVPDCLFDRQWATALVDRAVTEL